MQTRLPLTEDELVLHAALTSVAAGLDVDWTMVRDLVSAGFVHATTDRLVVTEAGRTFLAQLVPALQSGGIAA
jgi:ribosomal protein S19E (S16A)